MNGPIAAAVEVCARPASSIFNIAFYGGKTNFQKFLTQILDSSAW